jgi:hypothetical protein
MTKALPLLLMISALLAGCGSGAREAGPVPTATPAVEPAESEPAASTSEEGETSSEESGVFMNLTDVRVGAHDGYDRIVFEFTEPKPNPAGNGGVPYYEIRAAKPPFTQDPSDMPLEVFGDSFVQLIVQGATGYDFDGNPTYGGSRVLTPGFGTLAQAAQAGDFEATLSWIMGLSRPTCWQVQELHNPDRLVIDFHHV